MPISSDRAGGIPTQDISGIGEGGVTPAISDLMKAFREGFIDVQDLTRRGLSLPVEAAAQQQNLADINQIRPLARTAQAGALQGEINIQPRKQALAEGQTEAGINALPTPAEQQASSAQREKAAHIANGLASADPNTRLATVAQLTTDDVLNTWTSINGQPAPESIGTPDGKSAPRGTPDYFQALKKDVEKAALTKEINAAGVKALPEIYKEQAKTQAELPGTAAKLSAAAQGDVLQELHRSEALKRFEPQFEAFQKVDAIRESGRAPTNADDIAVIYEYVKLLDPTSAVREGELKLAQSSNPTVVQLYNQAKGLFSDHNKILGDGARQNMYQALDTLRVGAEKSAAPEIKRITNIAIDRGVPLDQVFTGPYQAILSGRTKATPGAVSTPNTPQPGDLVTLKDGRKIRVKTVTATGIIPDETYVP